MPFTTFRRMPNSLIIRRARENNLKEVSLEIPHNHFVAVTGLSGSGKSSLAFDTVYAEGQRRYIETFSPYTRQFFDKVKRPDVDSMSNVRPAVAIQQRTRILNSRSTVGSLTDVNDYLKVLWSNLAVPVCPECGEPLVRWTSTTFAQYLGQLSSSDSSAAYYVAAEVIRTSKKAAFSAQVERIQVLGYSRYLNPETGEIHMLDDEPPRFRASKENRLIFVLDRISMADFSERRATESAEQAFSLGGGVALLYRRSEDGTLVEKRFTTAYSCELHAVDVARPRPSLFSYNHPLGACSECNGFGKILRIDEEKVIPDPERSIEDGAIDCWKGESSRWEYKRLLAFCSENEIPIDRSWKKLTAEHKKLLYTSKSRKFIGLTPWFESLEAKKYKMHVRVFLSRYRKQVDCPSCNGTRVKKDALAYRIKGLTIAEIWAMPIGRLFPWIVEVRRETLDNAAISHQIKEVFDNVEGRLRFLDDLGLTYLTLDRQARTLSGGETQRVNLAAALGSSLISTHFVLDEPSVGLHARDTVRLIGALRALHARGNSLLVVEHDLECLEASDTIIEIGPKAGEHGGEITYLGPTREWKGVDHRPFTPPAEKPSFARTLTVESPRIRNLRFDRLEIPLDCFVAVTGVSGSGKSTLISTVIESEFQRFRRQPVSSEIPHIRVDGFDNVDDVVLVDQSPLAKSPRANIATYTKIWDRVRDLFASTDQAKTRHLTKSSFSFNVDAGRCPACDGAGFTREDMQFLSDVFVPCEACLGKRFQAPVLEVHLSGKSVDDLLHMTIEAAFDFFSTEASIRSSLKVLQLLGLGHLTLGHSLSELSGGEAQRLKLVPWIQSAEKKKALLIFDEPTTGLHTHDVEKLLDLFRELRAKGHSIICIEHNLRLVAESDWIIDLGPEGGENGGELVALGTPTDLIRMAKESDNRSYTATHLSDFVARYSTGRRSAIVSKAKPQSTSVSDEPDKSVRIRGAREHNLKNLALDVPLNSIVTFTGVSGSGKSTIAKDIIYAEGQRRYLDCLSPYARQFIKELKRPQIDDIRNVPPTVCVYQHTFQPTALSTVGTMSEVYNFLRLLFAKVGTQYCPDHPDRRISPLSIEQITQKIKADYQTPIRLLAPIIKQKKGNHRGVFERALETEISEVRVDGVFGSPGTFAEGLEKSKSHSIEFTLARCNPKSIPLDHLQEGVAQALSLGSGTIVINDGKRDLVLSSDRTCPVCQTGFFKPDPEDLSFNSKRGRCTECDGYGVVKGKTCTQCGGSRILPIGRNIRIDEKAIHELTSLTPSKMRQFFEDLEFESLQKSIAEPILRELVSKLNTLIDLGIDHVAIGRDCATLSGGELQRLRLASAIGSPLSGVLYIFDEPSAGLHPLDNRKLLSKLSELRDRGNSIIQIEHETDSILSSDHIVDVGPGAGRDGGSIVFNGTLEKFLQNSDSVTALSLKDRIQPSKASILNDARIEIEHANRNNLRDVSVTIPLHAFVTVAGVSGAGKSTLVHGVLAETLLYGKNKGQEWKSEHAAVNSSTAIDRVLTVDQNPIGANCRSTPASYLGIWSEIRNVFASSLEAKSRGWGPGFFSYNSGSGRCLDCKGQGEITLEMSFLAEAKVPCDTCNGSRYSVDAETVRYNTKTISQILDLTFEEAKTFFINHRKIHRRIKRVCDLGLGYLKLGQPSPTLSGGESQRLKLASELDAERKGHTLYILDEPTTGLHKVDVARLTAGLRDLVAQGCSVIVIEHDADLILSSQHVIELGPGPGNAGGKIVYSGPPAGLIKAKTPWGEVLSRGTAGKKSAAAEVSTGVAA